MPALTFPLAGALARNLNVTRRWPVAGGGVDPVVYSPVLMIDFTDRSKMSQDYSSNVPVTTVTDPVGHVDDLSGVGVPVQQVYASQRGQLAQDGNGNYCVRTDGIDDTYTGSVDMQGSKKGTVFLAYNVLSNAGTAQGIYIVGAADSDAGAMELYQYNADGKHYSSVKGTSQLQGGVDVPASVPVIVTQQFDLTTGSPASSALRVWVNNVEQTPSYLGSSAGSAALKTGSLTLSAMSAASFKAPIDWYGYIVYADHLSDEARTDVVNWLNARCGAF